MWNHSFTYKLPRAMWNHSFTYKLPRAMWNHSFTYKLPRAKWNQPFIHLQTAQGNVEPFIHLQTAQGKVEPFIHRTGCFPTMTVHTNNTIILLAWYLSHIQHQISLHGDSVTPNFLHHSELIEYNEQSDISYSYCIHYISKPPRTRPRGQGWFTLP